MLSYESWLSENDDYVINHSQVIDLLIGDTKITVDPLAEDWKSQIEHIEDYRKLEKDIKDALVSFDVLRLEKIIQKAKTTPLFLHDYDRVWRRVKGELGINASDKNFLRWEARYILNKLSSFFVWAAQNGAKEDKQEVDLTRPSA